MEGTTAIDYTTLSNEEVVRAARQAWENVGGPLPDEAKAELEPAFHELTARLESVEMTDRPSTF